MCVTVDDMPMVTYGMNQPEDQRAIISGLIEALKYHEVPAIGYVNESKLYRKNSSFPQRHSSRTLRSFKKGR
jgi:hypothetical protein